jgi:hypothetical protein
MESESQVKNEIVVIVSGLVMANKVLRTSLRDFWHEAECTSLGCEAPPLKQTNPVVRSSFVSSLSPSAKMPLL